MFHQFEMSRLWSAFIAFEEEGTFTVPILCDGDLGFYGVKQRVNH